MLLWLCVWLRMLSTLCLITCACVFTWYVAIKIIIYWLILILIGSRQIAHFDDELDGWPFVQLGCLLYELSIFKGPFHTSGKCLPYLWNVKRQFNLFHQVRDIIHMRGAGITQWLGAVLVIERLQVRVSPRCRSAGQFSSGPVSASCADSSQFAAYPFHPRVTAVARQ